jgi:hypothetical protein
MYILTDQEKKFAMSMAKSHGGSVIQRGYEIEQRPP